MIASRLALPLCEKRVVIVSLSMRFDFLCITVKWKRLPYGCKIDLRSFKIKTNVAKITLG